MKRFKFNHRLSGALAGALLTVALLLGFLSVQSVRAADPTPQGIASYIGVNLLQYGNASAAANGLGVLSPGFALADCYNNVTFQTNTPVNTVTVKLQNSEDGVNFLDTQSFTDITNTTEMSRVVLYGQFTRAIISAMFTSTNPITGSVQCKFTNQSR